MNKLLRTTFLTLLVAVANVVSATTYSYTFESKVFGAAGTKKLGDVSWTLATNAGYFGYDGTKGQQFGSGSSPASSVSLTTSAFGGEITSVKVNASTASNASATLYVKVGGQNFGSSQNLTSTATDYTFTGSASGSLEILFSQPTTSKALYIKSIEVTYEENVEQKECGLAYSADSYEAVLGGDNTFPTLSNPNKLTGITYTSSNTVVASVSESGKVTLNSTGSTTITASFPGNTLYLPGKASYELTVMSGEAPQPEDGAFVKVRDCTTLAAGDIIILVNESASKAMSTTQKANNRDGVAVTITNYSIQPSNNVQQITLEGAPGAWYLNVGNGRYLYAGSSSDNQLLTGAKTHNAKASIVSNSGDADIKFQGDKTRNWIRYNNSSSLFSCYASGQDPVQIYRMVNPTAVATNVEELAALEDDSNVKLVLADEAEARVLYATDGEAYVRTTDGAFCLSGVEPNVPFASNQHIAGTIVGKKTSLNGMTVFEATNRTNTAFLAIAEPVTEEEPQPVSIAAGEINDHLADWVAVEAVRVGDDAQVNNRFALTTADGFDDSYAYNGALADVAAIARPEALCPVSVNEVTPFTFVIDEAQEFVSPASDLANVPLRLVRTLSNGYWNTLCLPFGVTDWEGEIREYASVEGNKMNYKEATEIKAGVPYLFRPGAVIENPTFEGVTLSAAPAKTVTFGEYSFVGIYSPYELALDKTERFLGDGDNLYYPESSENNANKLRGMRAFFRVPADAGANIDLSGSDGIEEVVVSDTADLWFSISGQRVVKPQHGIYIHNGKKVVVK